jgi:hypothetical protein
MKNILLLLALGLILPVAKADRRDEDRRGEEPRVILYQDADFRGDSLVLHPGEVIDNFSGRTFANGNSLNDRVSSIRIEGGAEAVVFEEARFHGRSLRLTESVRDLSTVRLSEDRRDRWNDRISSIRVEGFRQRHEERERDSDRVIRLVYLDLLRHEPDDKSLRYYRGLMLDQGWTERKVREHIRHGEEFRRDVVDRIIRQAYEELLRREPDEAGLRDYRKAMIEQEWTETQIRDSLKHSDEYRHKGNGH